MRDYLAYVNILVDIFSCHSCEEQESIYPFKSDKDLPIRY